MVLPKEMRLKGHKCFDHIHRSGGRYHGSSMVLRVARPKPQFLKSTDLFLDNQACRCAVTISSKVSKKAVVRNRLRRQLHIHLKHRLIAKCKNPNNWALISLKPNSSTRNFQEILRECDTLLKAAGLLS